MLLLLLLFSKPLWESVVCHPLGDGRASRHGHVSCCSSSQVCLACFVCSPKRAAGFPLTQPCEGSGKEGLEPCTFLGGGGGGLPGEQCRLIQGQTPGCHHMG
jgi:hypothetical protein